MNTLMESMKTSSGLTLSLRWKNKRAEKEEQLDTRELVELLQKMPKLCVRKRRSSYPDIFDLRSKRQENLQMIWEMCSLFMRL